MSKKICLIHANCQGEAILDGLNASDQFRSRFQATLVTNYTREHVPDDLLKNCSLFLYQHLGPEWADLASETLLAKLPAHARTLCIPNCFYNGYWPLWDGTAGFDYRDIYLDELIDSGLSDEEVLMLYLRGNINTKFNLAQRIQSSLEHEAEKENSSPIKYLHIYAEHASKQQLFRSVNHPAPWLMEYIVRSIFTMIDVAAPDKEPLLKAVDFASEFELPIHPQVARLFGLLFANENRLYNVYGTPMTFARYTAHYIECRRSGNEDFIGYLCSFKE